MLTEEQVNKAAGDLYTAEINRQAIDPVTMTHPDMDMSDAYAIQKTWVDKKVADGREVVGYKIGLTSRAMQDAMKIDTPDYGVLLDDMLFDNGADIRARDFIDPRIEVELAFVLKDKLFGEDISIDDVLDATDYVVPALELIAARSHRVHPDTGYTRTVFDTISDNAANAGIITGGEKFGPRDRDLRWCGALCYLNDVLEETGLAAGVLDHPANGIRWIAKRFAPHGIALLPGQILLAGSFTRPLKVKAGDKIRADYGPLGEIRCNFV